MAPAAHWRKGSQEPTSADRIHQKIWQGKEDGDVRGIDALLQEGLIRWERLLGPRQVGCFASFDQLISLDVAPSASTDHLCLISYS
jgi:hypothetical protein